MPRNNSRKTTRRAVWRSARAPEPTVDRSLSALHWCNWSCESRSGGSLNTQPREFGPAAPDDAWAKPHITLPAQSRNMSPIATPHSHPLRDDHLPSMERPADVARPLVEVLNHALAIEDKLVGAGRPALPTNTCFLYDGTLRQSGRPRTATFWATNSVGMLACTETLPEGFSGHAGGVHARVLCR